MRLLVGCAHEPIIDYLKANPYHSDSESAATLIGDFLRSYAAISAGDISAALGFAEAEVSIEAQRCLQCPKPACINACPLHIDIKRFIGRLAQGDPEGAVDVISEQSPFPGVCGRVCQPELFCEDACLIGKKFGPVAIGSLERFAADHARLANKTLTPGAFPAPTGKKVALVGSGPASLIAAFDLVRKNYRVTIFEALHKLGGVLAYGIPNFRLPREILHEEIARLQNMGVEFVPDFIVGKRYWSHRDTYTDPDPYGPPVLYWYRTVRDKV